jgi:protocatechuate 3,4-dioxygenase beta subunit
MRTLVCGLIAALAFFQSPTRPSTGSLSVTGRVVTGIGPDTRPVRHARVTLIGGPFNVTRVSSTDTKGEYRFDWLASGDYHVSVRKPGFVTREAHATPGAEIAMVRGGAIEGIVADVTGDPLNNVAVSALQRQPGGAAPKLVGETRTDDLGRYRIHSLDAGEYVIQAATDQNSRSVLDQSTRGTTSAYYPSSASIEDARVVGVAVGRDVTSIDVTLTLNSPLADPARRQVQPPGAPTGTGRIAGRITDAASGAPIKNAVVTVASTEGIPSGGRTLTDARGRFEFTSLAARKYRLHVEAQRHFALDYGRTRPGDPAGGVPIDVAEGQDVVADMALPPLPHLSVEGIITDEFGDPAPGIEVTVAQKQYVAGRHRMMVHGGMYYDTDDTGHYRISGLDPGDYYVTALAGAFADEDDMGGFAPTYYPGTSDVGAAASITVAPGADILNVSFPLVPGRTVTVSGVMVDAEGKPVSKGASIWLITPDRLRRPDIQRALKFTADDGQFIFRNVPPGAYMLKGNGPAVPGGGRNDWNPSIRPFGSLPVTVGDSDLDGLVLKVTDGTTLRGRITLEEGDAPPLTPQQVRVSSDSIEYEPAPLTPGPPPSETHADWTFQVTHRFGRQRIFVNVGSPGWMLKSITRGGLDITDGALDFDQKDISDVEVVLTPKVTHVTGSVSDERGPVEDYAVVIFASDPTKWIDRSRFVAMARGAEQGRFDARALPPDDYLAVAVTNVNGTEWRDPEFLQAIGPLATSFTLQEGESKTLVLKVKARP